MTIFANDPYDPLSQPHFGGPHGLSGQSASQSANSSAQAPSGGTVPASVIYGSNFASLQFIANRYQSHSNEEVAKPVKFEGWKLGELIGWRGWHVTPEGFLRSMSANVVWAPGEIMDGKTHAIEGENGGDSGVYAYKKARDFLSNHAEGLDIYGKVHLWGDVIEHELGYRAEYCKIISLDHFLKSPAPHKLHIKDLRERYCAEAA